MSFINDENVIKRITYLSGISNCVGLVVWGFLIDRLPFKVKLTTKKMHLKQKVTLFFRLKTGVVCNTGLVVDYFHGFADHN